MSSVFVLTVNVKESGRFSRALVVSVPGWYAGLRTSVSCFSPSKPEIGPDEATVSQLAAFSLSEPSIM